MVGDGNRIAIEKRRCRCENSQCKIRFRVVKCCGTFVSAGEDRRQCLFVLERKIPEDTLVLLRIAT
jgi:hypothetical protein